jgi:hypothetical protein
MLSGGGMPFTVYPRLAGCTLRLQGIVTFSWSLHGVGNKVSALYKLGYTIQNECFRALRLNPECLSASPVFLPLF